PGGGEIIITCSNVSDIRDEPVSLSDGNFVKIIIQDNGVGINKEDIDKIFDPYFTTKHMGNGLGLAITNSIIKSHDGNISVHSTTGKGTTIIVYLPAAQQVDVEDIKEKSVSEPCQKARILIMDDETMVLDISKQMLDHLGHTVFLAKDGMEAAAVYKEHQKSKTPIDVTIMDLTIPGGMGGKDAVQEILKINPDAKVIVSSGYSNDPVMTNYQQYGFVGAITKPFHLTDLNKIINDILA
ncbi:MAG: response regulator, partial [Candidatus Delongbacteria bacterium]|nr:response regulator [Candidatus Delongbacteria bacterium]